MKHDINDPLPLLLGARVPTNEEWRRDYEKTEQAVAAELAKDAPVRWVDPQLAGMPSDLRHPAAPNSPRLWGRLTWPHMRSFNPGNVVEGCTVVDTRSRQPGILGRYLNVPIPAADYYPEAPDVMRQRAIANRASAYQPPPGAVTWWTAAGQDLPNALTWHFIDDDLIVTDEVTRERFLLWPAEYLYQRGQWIGNGLPPF